MGERLGDDHLLKLPVLGKLLTVRSQMSAALLLKRQVCLIRSSQGEISSFTLAASLAYRRGLRVLVGGMCETDYSGVSGLPRQYAQKSSGYARSWT